MASPRSSRSGSFPSPAWLLVTLGVLAGCHAGGPFGALLSGVRSPVESGAGLVAREAQDWQSNLVTSPRLAAERVRFIERRRQELAARDAFEGSSPAFRLQGSFGTAPTNWKTSTYPGVEPNQMLSAVPAADTVPNGLVAGMFWNANRHLFFLTNNGRLMRVDADNPKSTNTTVPPTALNLSDTFSNTALAMNSNCTRLYALSDTGKLYIVDPTSMTLLNSANPLTNDGTNRLTMLNTTVEAGATAKHLAPSVDPLLSSTIGTKDVVFVPLNNGKVYKYEINGSGASATFATPVAYNVATTASPIACSACTDYSAGSYKLAAPPTVIGGRIIVGDTAGVLHDFNSVTAQEVASYPLTTQSGIMAPVALEVADGSATFTNMKTHTNTTRTPDNFEPVYAFVNVIRDSGPVCAWVNLVSRTVLFSRPYFVDDTDTDATRKVRGNLHDYGYNYIASTGTVTLYADATNGDAVNAALTTGDTIPGSGGATFLASPLEPATTNLQSGSTATSGPAAAFLRFTIPAAAALPSKSIITGAKLTLKATTAASGAATTTTYPPRVYSVGSHGSDGTDGIYQRGTTNIWTAANTNSLGPSTHPVLFHESRSNALSGGSGVNSTLTFTDGTSYNFDVTPLTEGPVRQNNFAFALAYDSLPSGHQVYHQGGGAAWNGTTTFPAPRFRNPRSMTTPADVPQLELTYRTFSGTVPTLIPLTQPIIDATRQRVYVYDNNYLFCLKFTSTWAWIDASYTPLNTSGNKHTMYHAAYFGRASGARDGTTYLQATANPAVAYDFSSIFLINRKNQGTTTSHLAVSKIDLSSTRTGDVSTNVDLGGTEQGGTDATTPSIATTQNNTFTQNTQTVTLPFQLSRYPLLSPYERVTTTGGDLYFSMQQSSSLNFVYRFGAW